MAVGRITGPLLKENLLRDGVDLAFENDLLYLDVINGRVGIKNSSPDYTLDITGTARTTNLQVTTQATIGTTDVFTISGNTIANSNGTINLTPGGINPVVYQAKLVLDDLQISTNTIEVTTSNTNLEINTLGTGRVNVNSNMYINGDLHVTGTITADGGIGGTITLGDSNTDNVVFNADVNSNIIPDDDITWDLGSDPLMGGKQWKTLYANTLTTTNINVDDLTVNDDLQVLGTATFKGDVQFGDSPTDTITFTGTINSNVVPAANATYDLGTTDARWNNGYFANINVSNNVDVTGNITATGYLQLPQILISGNTVSTRTSGTDLQLTANGTGNVVFEGLKVTDNNIQSTATNANVVLTPQGTGNVVVNTNQSLVIPVGTTAERPASGTEANGMIRYNTTLGRYESWNNGYWLQLGGVISEDGFTRVLAEATPGANDNVIYFYANNNLTAYIDSTKLFAEQFETNNLNIIDNTISSIATDSNINLTTSGTGSVRIGNLAIRNNTITNVVSGAVTEFAETSTGYVRIAGTNGVVIPSGDLSTVPATTETGMIRFNTFYSYVEVFNGTSWVNVAGTSSGINAAQATDIGVQTVLTFG